MAAQTVTIRNDPEWDSIRKVERRRWRIDLPDGGRKFTRTKREAVEWCAELGYKVLTRAR